MINFLKDVFGCEKPKRHARILFVLKTRHGYGSYGTNFSSGLYNSAKFATDMLAASGFVTKLVEVVDNNSIDREVSLFHPDICIIEAIWVVPSKFEVLHRLHPKVKWVVRVHSEAAFLAQEGVAIDWLSKYPTYSKVFVAVNSLEAFSEMLSFYPDKMLDTGKLLYLPTYYPAPRNPIYKKNFHSTTINVACMGAIRQLKNNLIQAMAAMRFADNHGWRLRFHVNSNVFDKEGNSPYKSLVALFQNTRHELVQHEWMTHEDFVHFLDEVDIGMQVSFSETFCIVAADMVAAGVPIVGSPAIKWLDTRSKANTNSVNDISEKLDNVLRSNQIIRSNLGRLQRDSVDSREAWLDCIEFLD